MSNLWNHLDNKFTTVGHKYTAPLLLKSIVSVQRKLCDHYAGRAGKDDLESTGESPDVAAVDAILDILRYAIQIPNYTAQRRISLHCYIA